MKTIFSTSYSPQVLNVWLLFLRIAVAAFMLTHGLPKLNMLMEGQAAEFADPIGLGPSVSLVLVIFAEVVCSVLIMIGMATRAALLPLLINMTTIVFVVHADDPFSRKELGLMFLLVYITLLVTGAGKYSVDRMITNIGKKASNAR